jgi:hypothetical protein
MAQMFNPAHPGRVLRNSVLRKDGGISVTAGFPLELMLGRYRRASVSCGRTTGEITPAAGAAI